MIEKFSHFIRTIFQQRRKTIASLLKKEIHLSAEQTTDILTKLQIPPNQRPENISIPQFIDLFQKL